MTEHSKSFRDFMPVSPYGDDKARAGAPLTEGAAMADREAVIDALRTVHDPEIPVNIYELGLIYGLEITDENDVKITMSLTSPSCPAAKEIPSECERKVHAIDGVKDVDVHVIWDPPWGPEMISPEGRQKLGARKPLAERAFLSQRARPRASARRLG